MTQKIKTIEVREYDNLASSELDSVAWKKISEKYSYVSEEDKNGTTHTLLRHTKQGIIVQNFVGLLPIEGTVIEIYPKVSLVGEDKDREHEREVFYGMLRHYRKFNFARVADADIAKLKKFTLYEVFFYLFLRQTLGLVKRGIVSRYESTEDNLPYLKGRLLFPQQAVINSANKARFYVQYDEYTPNHAANRLIRKALEKLQSTETKNMRQRRQLLACFDDVPAADNIHKDWQTYQQHQQARTMRHYDATMQWVRLLLFNEGLTAYQGTTNAPSLLFPMEQVFEDFVSHHIGEHARKHHFTMQTQGPIKKMLKASDTGVEMFQMQPDITLSEKGGKVKFILDTKWKEIGHKKDKFGISQADMYQLFSYGKLYNCDRLMLIYPQNENFKTPINLTFNETGDSKMRLTCFPFDVQNPSDSAKQIIKNLNPDTPSAGD